MTLSLGRSIVAGQTNPAQLSIKMRGGEAKRGGQASDTDLVMLDLLAP